MMMPESQMAPRVSVCMLTYNHAPFITQALDSVLGQECDFAFEVLINDDCSTDGTTDIVRRYADMHPTIIRAFFHDENQFSMGKKAIPELYKQARGEYIAPLECDDAWADPCKLAKQVSFLEAHSDLVLCYGNVSTIDESGSILEARRIPEKFCRRLSREEMVRCERLIPTSTFMFRRPPDIADWIDDVDRVLNGDSFVCAMLAQYGEAGYVDIRPSLYRQHQGGVYSSLDEDYRRVARIRTFKVIHSCISASYRPLVADTVARAFKTRAEFQRRDRRYGSLALNSLALLAFAARHRPASAFCRDVGSCLLQLKKAVCQHWRIDHTTADQGGRDPGTAL